MAITTSTNAGLPAPYAFGDGIKAELLTYRILSGATSGTVTSQLGNLIAIFLDNQVKFTSAPTFSGNTATLAFVVPAETAASLVNDDITYTAVADQGQDGNSITIALVDGTGDTIPVTAGNEVVVVTGTNIVVRIDPTAVTGSTKQDVVTAIGASADASALITSAVAAGHEAEVAAVLSQTPLANGVTGGARGNCLLLGRA